MMSRGHEFWHPDPEFYYASGGGPMFDMGPYYLTALVQLLEPIKSIAGMTGKAMNERMITSEKKGARSFPSTFQRMSPVCCNLSKEPSARSLQALMCLVEVHCLRLRFTAHMAHFRCLIRTPLAARYDTV